MKKELNLFFIALKRLYKNILGFEEGTDFKATIEGIKKDISFRGHTAWILIFSIFIASIGLNVNSTAVIIGAMLISPLMGPILGIGLSIGTNDFETLLRSLKNLGIAIVIALFTSTLYFLVTPLNIEQSELLARTKPTILDVMIALFGGLAGIIAGSRKEKSNVIPGVAIATALMPPLCTAGYGLANLKLNFFFGAFYLFFINSVFISLSTFLVVRYLKFPMVKFLSSAKERNYKRIFVLFLVLTITPSAVIFFRVIQETRFKVAVEKFITEKTKFNGSELINYKYSYNDTLSTIDMYFIGKPLNEDQKFFLNDKLDDYGLKKTSFLSVTKRTQLNIHQESDANLNIEAKLSEFNSNLRLKILEDLYTKNEEVIKSKDIKIQLLEDELLKFSQKDTIPYLQLKKEINYHFPEISKYSFAKMIEVETLKDTVKTDTINVFLMNFDKKYKSSYKKEKLQRAEDWLKIRLEKQDIKTLEY